MIGSHSAGGVIQRRYAAWFYWIAALLLCAPQSLRAEPYRPVDDAEVLEQVPAADAARKLAPLRRVVQSEPKNLSAAIQLTEGYLRIGRETADPRFTSYAQATLVPWLQSSQPAPAVLVLHATVLQSSHQFAAALTTLDRALQLEPSNSQAWLTKATVLQVQGRYAEARHACSQLLQSAGQIIAVSCIANINSLNGHLDESYQLLQRLVATVPPAETVLRSWILGQLGEMAVRRGDHAAAAYFVDALALTPTDIYLKAAYADLLLTQQRNQEVIELLRDNEAQDVLLLRLAIAGKRLQTSAGRSWAAAFHARFEAAQRGGDSSHLREYSRFLLEVRSDAAQALEMARRNWQIQREPADVHVYVDAAMAANHSDAAEVRAWIRETGYEDNTLAPARSSEATL